MTLKTLPSFSNPFWQSSFPDPFVLKVRGRYYAYATNDQASPSPDEWVFPVLTSDDLVNWHLVGKAMRSFGAPYHSYWAPEVTEFNGRFYLYYAVHYADEFQGAIRVAVADQPEGPFIDSGHDLTSALIPWAIDPHVFRDQDGQWYLFMTIEYLNDPSGFVGSGNAVVRLLDLFTAGGPLTRVTPPSHLWQLFEAQRKSKNGIDWYTVEGPAVMRHRNRYYEMYSGGCYFRDNYAVSYAISASPMGSAGMQDSSWQDWPGDQPQEVLMHAISGHVLGPGHNSVVLGPNNADLYIAYHAWPADMSARRPFLDRLFWHGDALWTPAPTYLPQPVPAQPAFRDLFNATVLDPSWELLDGDWYLTTGEVVQNDPSSERALLQQQQPLDGSWLLEAHVRLLEGEGSFGILLRGEQDMAIAIASTLDRHLAIWVSTSQHEPLHILPLKADFHPHAWHRLFLSFSGSLLQIQLDGIDLLDLPISQTASSFALYTEHCSAAFTGVTLTQHFRDEFLEEAYQPDLLGWRAPWSSDTVEWCIEDGALVQPSVGSATHLLVKGSRQRFCEFGATMQLRQSAERPAFGLALVTDRDVLTICLTRVEAVWKLLVEGRCATSALNVELSLAETFDPEQWHTLRLLLNDTHLDLYLDGPQVLTTLELPEGERTCGLLTRDASAGFTGVWQTGFAL